MVLVTIIGWHRDIMVIPLRLTITGTVGSWPPQGRISASPTCMAAITVRV